jgi:chromosome partitioning protein
LRTIAIINQKGGCGKTTTSINLAAVLAAKGRKTLLVDMDPQSHCALGLAVPEAQITRSIADMLRAGLDGSLAFSDIVWQIARNFDLAPSTMALAALEQELSALPDKDRRLAQVLSTVADHYEFCVIDCPPSVGQLTFNALRAADEIIIPVETGYFALQGSFKQEATIQMLVRRINHHARFWVLATMYDVRTKLAREILQELRRHFGARLLPVVVHFNSKLKEAASFGQPITEYDPVSRGCEDFDELSNWLVANPPPAQSPTQETPVANPALSRAAELVERARALQARTAALSAKFASDPDITRQRTPGISPAPAPGISVGTPATIAPLTHAAAASAIAAASDIRDQTLDPRPQTLDPHSAVIDALTQPLNPQPPAARGGSILVAEAPAHTKPSATVASRLAKLFGVRATAQGLLFVQPANGAGNLHIAADFNNWNPQQTPMRRDEQLGVWQACVPVAPGRYQYRLVVDGRWIQDPYNQQVETNPFGELNNVIDVR